MFGLGTWEMMIVLLIAVLLFGKRLPEVGRSLGKGLVEFKKGLHGVEDEIHQATHNSGKASVSHRNKESYEEPTAPKFDPPESAPVEADKPADSTTASA